MSFLIYWIYCVLRLSAELVCCNLFLSFSSFLSLLRSCRCFCHIGGSAPQNSALILVAAVVCCDCGLQVFAVIISCYSHRFCHFFVVIAVVFFLSLLSGSDVLGLFAVIVSCYSHHCCHFCVISSVVFLCRNTKTII